MSKTFKMTITTKSDWSNCNESSLVLRQVINTFDLEQSLNIGIIKSALNDLNFEGKELFREFYLESFNEDQSLSEFYNELLRCLGESSSFKIIYSDEVITRLTDEERQNQDFRFSKSYTNK